MDMKFSFNVGASSLTFEGDVVLFDEKVGPLCERLLELVDRGANAKLITDKLSSSSGGGGVTHEQSAQVPREGTVNVVVAKFGGATCRDVLKAAAIHLALFESRERFSDENWETTARNANTWKAAWSNEKAKTKKRLISAGFVIENAAGVFSLSPASRTEVEAKLDRG